METRQIGKSGIETSALALGCWAIGGGSWWGDNDDRMSVDTIHRAFDLGIRWIDTGKSIWLWTQRRSGWQGIEGITKRQVIISTKCAFSGTNRRGNIIFPEMVMRFTGICHRRLSGEIWKRAYRLLEPIILMCITPIGSVRPTG